jgi:hypothetical protein
MFLLFRKSPEPETTTETDIDDATFQAALDQDRKNLSFFRFLQQLNITSLY